ncbi:MAG: STAS domain-containing protein [Nocardioidaceae bacterium]
MTTAITTTPATTPPGAATSVAARLHGPLDASTVSEARDRIRVVLSGSETDCNVLVIDLHDVERIDFTGLALVAATHARLRRRGGRLVLRGCRPQIRRAMVLSRLNRIVEVERTPRTSPGDRAPGTALTA